MHGLYPGSKETPPLSILDHLLQLIHAAASRDSSRRISSLPLDVFGGHKSSVMSLNSAMSQVVLKTGIKSGLQKLPITERSHTIPAARSPAGMLDDRAVSPCSLPSL